MEYCTDLFQASTIERFIGFFKNILTQISENPSMLIGDIELLNEDERVQVLDEFNDF